MDQRAKPKNYPTRAQFFEIMDLPWLPTILHEHAVELLRLAWTMETDVLPKSFCDSGTGSIGSRLAGVFTDLEERGVKIPRRVLDLGSGASGPISLFAQQLPDIQFTLTDINPHPQHWSNITKGIPNVNFNPRSVDATKVEDNSNALRTVFAVLHHFPPPLAEKVLASAVRDQAPIFICEGTDRSLISAVVGVIGCLLPMLIVFLEVLTLRRRFIYLLLLPISSFILAFDGVVSGWRTYTIDECHALIAAADPQGRFEWTVEDEESFQMFGKTIPGCPTRFVIGLPKQKKSDVAATSCPSNPFT